MEHSVTVMVDGVKMAEFDVSSNSSDWDMQLRSGMLESARKVGATLLEREDDDLRGKVPEGWQNEGKVKRQVETVVGRVDVQRRVYTDERGKPHKPLDAVIGLEPYQRETLSLQQMGAYLASRCPYRHAAELLGWLIDTRVTPDKIKRMVWAIGGELQAAEQAEREAVFERGGEVAAGTITSDILYAEMDGVWLSLQREEKRRTEARLGIFYTGKDALGKGRYALRDKVSVAGLVEDSEEWQERVFLRAYQHYDLQHVQHVVLGGDGGNWIRDSLACLEQPVTYELCRFHLFRDARRTASRESEELIRIVRTACEKGLSAVEEDLHQLLIRSQGKEREKLIQFYNYLCNQADALVDHRIRLGLRGTQYRGLGAIEGNVDKQVAQRMKRRGMSWRIPGAKAMIALCMHRDVLAEVALRPKHTASEKDLAPRHRRRRDPHTDHAAWLQASVPARNGPAEGRPWVQKLRQLLNGEPDLPVAYALPSKS